MIVVPRMRGRMDKALQAKHLDDATILEFVRTVNDDGRWALIWDFEDILPDVPHKVIRAKCKSLIRRKLLQGCTCGCRGDFFIPGGQWGD